GCRQPRICLCRKEEEGGGGRGPEDPQGMTRNMNRNTFATRWNLDALESAYQRWQQDPNSVEESWRLFFEGFELGAARPAALTGDATCQAGVIRLIDAYRSLGHLVARLDPLSEAKSTHPLLQLSGSGFKDAALDRSFASRHFLGPPPSPLPLSPNERGRGVGVRGGTLRDLIDALQETYCRTIGVEYMHIQDTRIRRWLEERMEPRHNQPNFSRRQKL